MIGNIEWIKCFFELYRAVCMYQEVQPLISRWIGSFVTLRVSYDGIYIRFMHAFVYTIKNLIIEN